MISNSIANTSYYFPYLYITHEAGRVSVGVLYEKILWNGQHGRPIQTDVFCKSPHLATCLHDMGHTDTKVFLIKAPIVLAKHKIC